MGSKLATRHSWSRVRFGDVVENVNDQPKRSTLPLSTRYIAGEHVDESRLTIDRWGTLGDDLVPPTFKRRFQAGDVLFHSRNLKKIAVPNFGGITGEKLFVLRSTSPDLLQEFVPYVLLAPTFTAYAEASWSGSVNKFLNWTPLAKYEFELPSIQDQQRIARVAQLADRVHEETTAAATACDRVSLAYLEKTISPLLDGEKNDRGHNAFTMMSLEDLCHPESPICYGIVQVGAHDDTGIPTLAIHSFRSLENVHRTARDIESKYTRSRVRAGDLLVSVKGTVGLIDAVPEGFAGNISRDLARIRLDNSRILNNWVLAVWATPLFQRRLRSLVVGSTRAELSIATLRSVRVPVVPLAEQDEVCRKWLALRHSYSVAVRRRVPSSLLRTRLLLQAFA